MLELTGSWSAEDGMPYRAAGRRRTWGKRLQLQIVVCLLLWPGAGVGGGERSEDLFWLPGHVRVGGAVFVS